MSSHVWVIAFFGELIAGLALTLRRSFRTLQSQMHKIKKSEQSKLVSPGFQLRHSALGGMLS